MLYQISDKKKIFREQIMFLKKISIRIRIGSEFRKGSRIRIYKGQTDPNLERAHGSEFRKGSRIRI